MRKFDPWPVFFRREWSRNWPFLAGFAITGALITKFTAGLTEEDAKNSRFVQEHNRLPYAFGGMTGVRHVEDCLLKEKPTAKLRDTLEEIARKVNAHKSYLK